MTSSRLLSCGFALLLTLSGRASLRRRPSFPAPLPVIGLRGLQNSPFPPVNGAAPQASFGYSESHFRRGGSRAAPWLRMSVGWPPPPPHAGGADPARRDFMPLREEEERGKDQGRQNAGRRPMRRAS